MPSGTESLHRLADQFRRDVHAAVGEVVGEREEPASGGGSTWPANCSRAIHGRRRQRFARGADGSKDVRRESYALPKDSTAAIAVDRATSPADGQPDD